MKNLINVPCAVSLCIKKITNKLQLNSFLFGSAFNAFIIFAYHQPKHLKHKQYIF